VAAAGERPRRGARRQAEKAKSWITGCSGPSSDSRPALYRLFGPYRGDFLGDYGETAEHIRTECRADRDLCRIAPAGDQHSADARDVVPCIKGMPRTAEIGFEPSREIHWRVRDRHANIAQIARAVPRRDVHAATKRDCQVSEVPADAGAIAVSLPRRPGAARMFVAKRNVVVNVITDGLNPAPAEWGFPEQRLCDLGQPVGFAVAAAQ